MVNRKGMKKKEDKNSWKDKNPPSNGGKQTDAIEENENLAKNLVKKIRELIEIR